MVVLLKWWTASSGGPSKVVVPTKYIGRLKCWAQELCPNAHRLCLCLGPLKFNEISFLFIFQIGPLAPQGPGPWTHWPLCKSGPDAGGPRSHDIECVEEFSVLSLNVTVNDGF